MNWSVILLLCITYRSDGLKDCDSKVVELMKTYLNGVTLPKTKDCVFDAIQILESNSTDDHYNELRTFKKLYEQLKDYHENKSTKLQNNYDLLRDRYIVLQEKHIALHERLVATEQSSSNSKPNDNVGQIPKGFENHTIDSQPSVVMIYENSSNVTKEERPVSCNCTYQAFDKIKRKKKTRGKYLGCFKDQLDRVLKGYCLISRSMTVEKCIDICRNGNYVYAGLQYGETCSCDNLIQYDELTENKCDVVCTGNGNQYCGGHWTNSIYETGIEYYLMDEEGRELSDSYIAPSSHCSIRLQGDGNADP